MLHVSHMTKRTLVLTLHTYKYRTTPSRTTQAHDDVALLDESGSGTGGGATPGGRCGRRAAACAAAWAGARSGRRTCKVARRAAHLLGGEARLEAATNSRCVDLCAGSAATSAPSAPRLDRGRGRGAARAAAQRTSPLPPAGGRQIVGRPRTGGSAGRSTSCSWWRSMTACISRTIDVCRYSSGERHGDAPQHAGLHQLRGRASQQGIEALGGRSRPSALPGRSGPGSSCQRQVRRARARGTQAARAPPRQGGRHQEGVRRARPGGGVRRGGHRDG